MTDQPIVDVDRLRDQVRDKYRAVATDPDAPYHFHTGRPLAARLGYATRRCSPQHPKRKHRS